MTQISTNAKELYAKWLRRKSAMDKARRIGLRSAAIAVDRAQVKNLGGSGDAGSYPVPVRTGNLRGGHFFDTQRSDFAVIGNTTVYATVVHKDRPFLDDAAESVDTVEHMAIAFRKEVLA